MLDEQLVESETADQQHAEQRVKYGRFHLDENIIAQIKRQTAEDQNDDRGKQGHRRQVPIAHISHAQREKNRRHETCGRGEYAEILVRPEEYDEWPQIERNPDQLR